MYRIASHHDIKLNGPASTIMYNCESYQKNLDNEFSTGAGDFSQTCDRKSLINGPSSASSKQQQSPKKTTSSHHHPGGISDFETRQLSLLNQLQQVGTRLDKLAGISDNKKRTGAQAKDVKRQKTESMCQPDDPPVPETIVLKEQPNFASYESTAEIKKDRFPLNIVVGYSKSPPYALLALASLIRERWPSDRRIGVKAFLHSSLDDVLDDSMTAKVQEFNRLANDGADLSQCQYTINFIFKKVPNPKGVQLLHGPCVESRTSAIFGEILIAKYLASWGKFYPYPSSSESSTTPAGTLLTLDYWTCMADSFAKLAYADVRHNVIKEMENVLSKRRFLAGDRVTFADLIVWAAFHESPRVSLRRSCPWQLGPKVREWFLTLNSSKHFEAARALLR